jgi:hypothetical protein
MCLCIFKGNKNIKEKKNLFINSSIFDQPCKDSTRQLGQGMAHRKKQIGQDDKNMTTNTGQLGQKS